MPCYTNNGGNSCLHVAPSSSKHKTYCSVKKQGKEVKQQNETKKWLSKSMSKIQASSSALYMQVLQTSKVIWELLSTAESSRYNWTCMSMKAELVVCVLTYVTMKNRCPQIKEALWQRPKRAWALKNLMSWQTKSKVTEERTTVSFSCFTL